MGLLISIILVPGILLVLGIFLPPAEDLPAGMLESIGQIVHMPYMLDAIFPVTTFYICLGIVLFLDFTMFLWKIVNWAIRKFHK